MSAGIDWQAAPTHRLVYQGEIAMLGLSRGDTGAGAEIEPGRWVMIFDKDKRKFLVSGRLVEVGEALEQTPLTAASGRDRAGGGDAEELSG